MSSYSALSESKPTKHVLLYQGGCGACSKVADLVTGLGRTDLDARSIESDTVQRHLEASGIASPRRPALLVTGESGTQVLVGLAMRRHLAGLLGWRQAHVIMRLSAAELRARASKTLAADTDTRLSPQRRRLLKLGVGIPLIAAGISATATEAHAETEEPDPAGRNCLVTYECGYSIIAAGGKVYFCESFCDILTGQYCFDECYLCG